MKTIGLNQTLKESATLAINQLALKKRNTGEKLAHLGFGQSPFPVPRCIQLELMSQAARHEYLPTFGLQSLRDVFVEYYNKKFNTEMISDNVVIAPGSKEFIFQVLLLSQARVLIPEASWVSYGPQADILGKDITYLKTSFESRFLVTPEVLEDACKKEKSKELILILNSPSNPTGQMYSKEELSSLLPILKKYNVTVISDEIYADTAFGEKPATSLASLYPERTIVTTGLSKAFSAGGYRLGIGYIPEGHTDLKKDIAILISETYSCVSAPIQYAAKKAYESSDEIENYLKAFKYCLKETSDYLADYLHEYGFAVQKAQGGFYLFPNLNQHREKLLNKGIKTSTDLANYLLNHYNIATLPGEDFYKNPNDLSLRMANVDFDGEKVLELILDGAKIDANFIKIHTPNIQFAIENFEKFAKEVLS